MLKIMRNLTTILQRQKAIIFVHIFVLVSVVYMCLCNFCVKFFNIPDIKLFEEPPSLEKYGVILMLVLGVLIAPLLETFLFQKLPYVLLSRIKPIEKRKYIIVLVAVFLFGLEHLYSLQYMVYAIGVGVMLMYAYVISIGRNPFWRVFAIHAIFNCIVMITEMLNLFPE